MSTPLSLALIGFWHVHATDYAAQVVESEGAELVVAWDDQFDRGRPAAQKLGIPFATDLDEVLSRPDVDGIVVTTSTAAHTDVIGRAIAAGKHVFTEKLLAPTVAECEQLVDAARAAGVRLVVSLPRLSESVTETIAAAIRDGSLGDVTYTRVRLAHDGSVAGWLPSRFYDPADAIGGALTDLGCHAVYLTQRFLGTAPETVSAVYSSVTGEALEDNAVVTLRYPGGAIAVIEASNVTTPGASTIEVRGTKGTLVFGFAGLGLLGKGDAYDPEKWIEPEAQPAPPMPMAQWLSAIRSGSDTDANTAAAIELTRLVQAANASAVAGRTLDYRVPAITR
ncbi:Gfo/Idh/MocA family protein [Naasia aerilata]|uniref:Dehydrogenase n=1 Tax=Naasia aerilata TaxID=1162966 RepID=A0ABM8GBU9_9MICO|nr:Gfo/Idh/MocA family oxidoreductase [Naasia aerilata]BDZ45704.1 dehydrogenase [Naasia aerilata]